MDVLVINADLGPLHRVSLRHAVRMLVRQVAEIHEAEPDRLIGVYPMPTVVRLVRYVVTKWRYTRGPAWSRAGVLRPGRPPVRLLRRPRHDGRPRPAPLPRRPEHLAQHRRRLRRLQPAQGRPHPGRGRDGDCGSRRRPRRGRRWPGADRCRRRARAPPAAPADGS